MPGLLFSCSIITPSLWMSVRALVCLCIDGNTIYSEIVFFSDLCTTAGSPGINPVTDSCQVQHACRDFDGMIEKKDKIIE